MNAARQPTEHHANLVRSEEDRVSTKTVLLVGLGSLAVFFLGSFITVSYLSARERAHGPPIIPPEIGLNKIGMVEQQTFDLTDRGMRARARQVARLGSLGWVDRPAGVAHIPIEEAMRLVASGVRPGAPGGGAPPPGGQP